MGWGKPYRDYTPREKAMLKALVNRHRRRGRERLWGIKGSLGCCICGYSNAIALDFHHMIPSDKLLTISNGTSSGVRKSRIDCELRKCVVLCQNCHSEVEFGEKHVPEDAPRALGPENTLWG